MSNISLIFSVFNIIIQLYYYFNSIIIGDVFRGLEIVEAACSVGNAMMGESLENLSKGLDTYSYRQPLGVTAGICPFNFPVRFDRCRYLFIY